VSDAFDLSIVASESGGPPVAVARCGNDFTVQELEPGALSTLAAFRKRLDGAIRGEVDRPSADEMRGFGQSLFKFLVHEQVDLLYNRLPAAFIRLHLFSNQAALQELPWEFLQNPVNGMPADASRSVVRIVPTIGTDVPAPVKLGGRVRVLFVSADPHDQDSGVNWAEAEAVTRDTFTVGMPPGTLDFKVVEGSDVEAFRVAVLNTPCDILHFSGHGEVVNGVGRLIFQNRKNNKSEPLDAKSLAVLLKNRNIRLVVLSSCDTAAGNFASRFAVIAETLVRSAGIPAVVANQFPVKDETTAPFVRALYRKLLSSGDIDQAMADGRATIFTSIPGKDPEANFEWGIPTLYRQLGANMIFEP
jgi:hypothetical protein